VALKEELVFCVWVLAGEESGALRWACPSQSHRAEEEADDLLLKRTNPPEVNGRPGKVSGALRVHGSSEEAENTFL